MAFIIRWLNCSYCREHPMINGDHTHLLRAKSLDSGLSSSPPQSRSNGHKRPPGLESSDLHICVLCLKALMNNSVSWSSYPPTMQALPLLIIIIMIIWNWFYKRKINRGREPWSWVRNWWWCFMDVDCELMVGVAHAYPLPGHSQFFGVLIMPRNWESLVLKTIKAVYPRYHNNLHWLSHTHTHTAKALCDIFNAVLTQYDLIE